jgi:septum site-determining protein MinD
VLAVAGGKGGSGKTTTALGIAAALAERRRRPLVVDCDVDAPNLHLRAGVPRDPGIDATGPPAENATGAPNLPGVDVLPAGLASVEAVEAVVRELPNDRPVVLDCPAGASESATLPLRVADGAIVVTTLGRESIEDGVKTASIARAVGTDVEGVAVTGESSVPDGLRSAFGASTVVAVPEVESPLDDGRTAAAYAAIAGGVADRTASVEGT